MLSTNYIPLPCQNGPMRSALTIFIVYQSLCALCILAQDNLAPAWPQYDLSIKLLKPGPSKA